MLSLFAPSFAQAYCRALSVALKFAAARMVSFPEDASWISGPEALLSGATSVVLACPPPEELGLLDHDPAAVQLDIPKSLKGVEDLIHALAGSADHVGQV
jgi:hypothetical protein